MKTVLFTCSLLMLFAVSTSAQKTKPWTEWSEKDVEKILNDSGWGQTQTEGDSSSSQSRSDSAITATTAAREREVRNTKDAANVESGEQKAVMSLRYYVRLLSAKPIRAAFVRMIELQGAPPERVAQLRPFVDRDFGDYIVVTISMDGDRKRMGPVMQELIGGDPAVLKSTTYLERKDGKRVALMDYRAPIQDGLGAKFVFPRMVEGKPFIDANSGEIRFATELGKTVKISRRFKVTEMMYDGKLEF